MKIYTVMYEYKNGRYGEFFCFSTEDKALTFAKQTISLFGEDDSNFGNGFIGCFVTEYTLDEKVHIVIHELYAASN